METPATTPAKTAPLKGLSLLVGIVIFMFIFAIFILPPFYDAFCKLTGLNGKVTQVKPEEEQALLAAENAQTSESLQVQSESTGDTHISTSTKPVRVQFVTDVDQSIPWEFHAVSPSIDIVRGKKYTVHFSVTNKTNQAMVGRAIPSITPSALTAHMKKIECFCFQAQPLKPFETRQMSLVFYLDSKTPIEYEILTLAYKLYLSPEKGEKVAFN